MSTPTEHIKQLRQRIDSLMSVNFRFYEGMSVLQAQESQVHHERCRQSLAMAKGWLGKYMGYTNVPNPYHKADRPEDIPETQDVADAFTPPESDEVQDERQLLHLVNAMRDEIKAIISVLEDGEQVGDPSLYGNLIGSVPPVDEDGQVVFEDVPQAVDGFIQLSCLMSTWRHLHEASMHLGFELERMRRAHNTKDYRDAIHKKDGGGSGQ